MKPQKLKEEKHKFFSNRLRMVSIVIGIMFTLITYQFYKIQIIQHHKYDKELRATVQKEVEIPAIRGLIYDRYGKPLAVNKSIYVLKYDPQVTLKKGELDQILLKLANLLEANGDTYLDHVPVSNTVPFVFTEDTQSVKRFITSYVPYNDNAHKEVLYGYSARELIAYLRGEDVFNIAETLSDEEARKVIAMRLQIRQTTYQKYKTVTLAQNISMKSLAKIEESRAHYAGIIAEVEAQRYYPFEKAFGNVLGYTRMITESQYETMADKGYEKDDIIGQVGVESEMELQLRGEKGNKLIEVDNVGRTVFTLETKEATAGNDVYLTLDADLQVAAYNALEKRLSEGIIARLQGAAKTTPLTGREILISMAKNNQLDLKEMSAASEETAQRGLYQKVVNSYEAERTRLDEMEKHLSETEKTELTLKQHFANMLESEPAMISDTELLLSFIEQGTLQLSEKQVQDIKKGTYNLKSLLINQLETGGLTPDQTDIMPCSGTAVVVDPSTGQTLALVSYPSYDNNEFTQNFNRIYTQLHDGVDTRNIEINRALKTAKAPGSTFKMITGIAGLEEEVVDVNTSIYDSGEFTKAGHPYPKCWIFTNTGSGHGSENIMGALEESCNYYFYEVAYRLGLKFGAPYGGIDKLTQYVEQFGLSEKTGIELEETVPNVSNPTTVVYSEAVGALKKISELKEPNKSALFEKVATDFNLGRAPNLDEIDEKIEDLTKNTIQRLIGSEVTITVNEDLQTIYNKLLEDYSEELDGKLSEYARAITSTVISGDHHLSLKYRLKQELLKWLNELVQPGTRKTIRKTIQKLPEGLVQQAYREAYEEARQKLNSENETQPVVSRLDSHIEALRNDTFDWTMRLEDQIINGILNTYIDERFKKIEMEWTVADNVRTAIGQGDNAFTPVQMARYMAGLANGKTVYNLTIINGIKDHKKTGNYIENPARVFKQLELKETTITAIHSGMNLVTKGAHGTARTYFSNFPIEVAAKTGTAQENSWENAWFVGFAPYHNPELAVVTSMYGADGLGGYNIQVAKDILEHYFKVNQTSQGISLDNQFAQ